MPLLIFLLIVALVATFGFWDTLQAILGGIALMLLLALLVAALVAAAGYSAFRRFRRRL